MYDSMGDFRVEKRQMTWDMIAHEEMYSPDVQQVFGLSPASRDVLDMEHAASDDRLEAVTPIYRRIKHLCGIGSAIAHRAMLNYPELQTESDHDPAVIGVVATALTTAVVTSLIHEGLISLTPEETDV